MRKLPLAERVPERTKGCCEDLPEPLSDMQASDTAGAFRALGDPTRVQMIHMLKRSPEPVCVCDFTAAFDLGQPTISHHLSRLRDAGFIESFKQGIWIFYRLNRQMPPEVKRVLALVP